jgi:hypothetical protein
MIGIVEEVWACCRRCGNPSQLTATGGQARVLECANPHCDLGIRKDELSVQVRGVTELTFKRQTCAFVKEVKQKQQVIRVNFSWVPVYNS